MARHGAGGRGDEAEDRPGARRAGARTGRGLAGTRPPFSLIRAALLSRSLSWSGTRLTAGARSRSSGRRGSAGFGGEPDAEADQHDAGDAFEPALDGGAPQPPGAAVGQPGDDG